MKGLFSRKTIGLIMSESFGRYLVIGITTFLLDFGIYKLLIWLFEFDEIPANLTSVLLSLLFNFTMSNFWTFKSGRSNQKSKLVKYSMLATFNYIINNALFAYIVSTYEVPALMVKVGVTALVVLWNFVLYRFWIFTPEITEPELANS